MNKFLLMLICISFFSCKKGEGPGGTSTITGSVFVQEYSGSIFTGKEYDGADVDVFIIYGDESNMYDEKISTSFDGSFEFRYLRPGKYTIFVYSKEPTDDQELTPVIKTAEITGKNEVVTVGEITIKE